MLKKIMVWVLMTLFIFSFSVVVAASGGNNKEGSKIRAEKSSLVAKDSEDDDDDDDDEDDEEDDDEDDEDSEEEEEDELEEEEDDEHDDEEEEDDLDIDDEEEDVQELLSDIDELRADLEAAVRKLESRRASSGQSDDDEEELQEEINELKAELAVKLAKTGAVDEANSLISEILASQPDNVDAWLAEARIKAGAGDLEGAISRLMDYVESYPETVDDDALELLGKLLKKSGNTAEALARLEASLQANPYDDDVYDEIAEILEEQGDDGVKVFLQGQRLGFDVPPQIREGRTLVPFRAIGEALDAEVTWDGETRIVTVQKVDLIIILPIGSETVTVNGVEQTIDVPATLVEGRTLVPARFISEAFGLNVDWRGNSRAVIIRE